MQTRNDLTAAVPKFCLSLETHRRTSEGRVRTSQEFLTHFFPHDTSSSTDRLFRYMPNDVRGPILAAWGIRGAKAALRDDDAKVQSVVHDALVAGDIDHAAFEEGLQSDTVVRWAPLADWWTFWRGGKLSKVAIQKALSVAYDLQLFDAKWFLDTIEGRGGKLRGTDVIADGLSKDDLTEWMRNVHHSGDGSPKGLLAAIGWDKVVAKTANEVLISVIDAMVQKVGLVKPAAPSPSPGPGPEKSEKGAGDRGSQPSVAGGASAAGAGAATSGANASASAAMSGASAATSGTGTGGSAQTGERAAANGAAGASSGSGAVPAARAAASDGNRPTRPPGGGDGDIEWTEETGKDHPAEVETTVSQRGEILAGPESSAADDGMIVVVDDEVDLSATDSTALPHKSDHDPPTARKLEAAQPVAPDDEPAVTRDAKGAKRSDRPPPPPRPTRAPNAR